MRIPIIIALALFARLAEAQPATYCNPLNIDYGYSPIPNFSNWGRHRTTADPVIVNHKGTFLLFSTNQWGYWYSKDLSQWTYVPKRFLRSWNDSYDELCAPAVGIVGDTVLVMGSTYNRDFTIWMSTNPLANEWKPLVDRFDIGGWDPDFFADEGKLYMYNGSSNKFPLYGIELNRKSMQPIGTRKEMYLLEPDRYGWQRFGEHMDNTFLDPFMEGAHMTKHKGKYYLQYGAPGTEFSGYADGVVVGDSPLGLFVPQSDPLSIKLGGFVRGAGHGSTFQDNEQRYWHTSTNMISVKNTFERRISIWPAGFDDDGVMWCNTAFGDYPHYLPHTAKAGTFTGWMLLNYGKPVMVSSTLGSYVPNYANDENMKTYWSAATGTKGEWIRSDLGIVSNVYAVQINFADQDVPNDRLGKRTDQFHQFKVTYSTDGKTWKVLVDKSNNKTDVPHDYIELSNPVKARYIQVDNVQMPAGTFAMSGLRVFGKSDIAKPRRVKDFVVLRTEKDKRSAFIKWSPVDEAYAYNLYYGTDPEKLYTCIMVHGNNEYWLKTMDRTKTYYFTIEPVNEAGPGERVAIVKAE